MVSWRSLKAVIVRALRILRGLNNPEQLPLGLPITPSTLSSRSFMWAEAWLTSPLSWAMTETYLSSLCSCHVDGSQTYTEGNLSPERISHMVVLSCFQSCLWSCLLLLLTGSLDKLYACFISLLCLGLMLGSVISSIMGPLWLGRALPSECSEHSWWLFPVGWPCSLCFPELLLCDDPRHWGRGVGMVKKQTN